jgi:hypothetical protein
VVSVCLLPQVITRCGTKVKVTECPQTTRFSVAYMIEISSMKKFLLYLLLFAATSVILVLTTASSASSTIKEPVIKDTAKGFALVELFTSQGCSSCPAADRLLGKYAAENNEHIIAIAFHVDYWNRLGWKDPFSNAAFSDRQRHYASGFGNETVYTPQAVINGSNEMVGSDAQKLAAGISQATAQQPKAAIAISNIETVAAKVSFTYTISGAYNGTIINAALVQRNVETSIGAGENSGLQLSNYNVVRDFTSLSSAQNSGNINFTLPAEAKATAYSLVLYLQEDGNGKITAAIKKDL